MNVIGFSDILLSFNPSKKRSKYEKGAHLLEVEDFNLDFLKVEPKVENETEKLSFDIEEHKVNDNYNRHHNKVNNAVFTKVEPFEENQAEPDSDAEQKDKGITSDKRIQSQQVMLTRHSASDFALIADVYSFVEEYKAMACSGRSLLCCQPAVCDVLVKCLLCGEHYMGKADRLLKLFNHFESIHCNNATELILEEIQRYKRSISQMRKTLEFDKWFGASNYKHVTRFMSDN